MMIAVTVLCMMLLGATVQRVAGLGFGLVAATGLTIALGPVAGIVLLNIVGPILGVAMIVRLYRDVDWSIVKLMTPWIIVGALPAIAIIRIVDRAVLEISIGVLLVILLGIVIVARRASWSMNPSWAGRMCAFFASFCAVLASVPGPALTMYAAATKWKPKVFVATLQPVFLVITMVTLGMKWWAGVLDFTGLTPLVWAVSFVGAGLGLWLGSMLSRRIPPDKAFTAALIIAVAGAVLAVGHGVENLI